MCGFWHSSQVAVSKLLAHDQNKPVFNVTDQEHRLMCVLTSICKKKKKKKKPCKTVVYKKEINKNGAHKVISHRK